MTLRLAEDSPERGTVKITPATQGVTVVVLTDREKVEVPPDENTSPQTFTVYGVPVGTLTVFVGAEGKEWVHVDVPVQANGTADVRIDELPVASEPEPKEQCGGPGFPPCAQTQQSTAKKGVPWQYYALGGLFALGLVGWGLQNASLDEEDKDEPEGNPRRRGGRW